MLFEGLPSRRGDSDGNMTSFLGKLGQAKFDLLGSDSKRFRFTKILTTVRLILPAT